MNLLRKIHTAYGFAVFGIVFLFFIPFLAIPMLLPRQFKLIGIINRAWAKLLFIFVYLPWRVEGRNRLDKRKQYIFCPNHFSYLDIPTLGLNPVNAIFVGKSEMEKIPLFGYMYGKLHITVNRKSLKSKFNTLKRTLEALDEGKSLVIFPEGGIITHQPPHIGRFKDGAFRAAIEKQIPVVPVTIPYNWIILPDSKSPLLHQGTIKIIFHEPIQTTGMTLDDLDQLNEKVHAIIDHELQRYHANGAQRPNTSPAKSG
jgi:1-acyl-sn-glycerol-3-phosphate acyltransferase